jgi:hypothetical protein
MSVPASEVGYTSATTRRGDHEVHKGHVVVMAKKYSCLFSSKPEAFGTVKWGTERAIELT